MASDLHMHTTFSDGKLTPEELVAQAKAAGLKYIAITDHDTVDGVSYLYENGMYPTKGIHVSMRFIFWDSMWIFIIPICWIS